MNQMTEERAAQLRVPFTENVIGKLPRSTCKACSSSPRKRCQDHQWISGCPECRGSHSTATIHLDFVGHAAVTDRLLAVDPSWTWEPFALTSDGLPALDRANNLWIKLTVCGVTRVGVGDGPNAKELIGDALRNAAMRFGVALDLWTRNELEWYPRHAERLVAASQTSNLSETLARPATPAASAPADPPASTMDEGPPLPGDDSSLTTPSSSPANGEPSSLRGEPGGGEDQPPTTSSPPPPPDTSEAATPADAGDSTATASEATTPPMGGGKRKAVFAALGRVAVGDDERHAMVSRILRREVTSFTQMSSRDADFVLDTIAHCKTRADLDALLDAADESPTSDPVDDKGERSDG